VLPIVVFIMGVWLGPEPSTELLEYQNRVDAIVKRLRIETHQLAIDASSGLWSERSFWGIEDASTAAYAEIRQLPVTHFGGDLAHPFEIGRGWWCGVGTPAKRSRW
jgi:hypothetical protein